MFAVCPLRARQIFSFSALWVCKQHSDLAVQVCGNNVFKEVQDSSDAHCFGSGYLVLKTHGKAVFKGVCLFLGDPKLWLSNCFSCYNTRNSFLRKKQRFRGQFAAIQRSGRRSLARIPSPTLAWSLVPRISESCLRRTDGFFFNR